MEATCETCDYFTEFGDRFRRASRNMNYHLDGVCRRYPPISGSGERALQPEVAKDDACGEHPKNYNAVVDVAEQEPKPTIIIPGTINDPSHSNQSSGT